MGGLVTTSRRKARERRREAFLVEWNGTLQYLRDIAHLVSKRENQPSWIEPGASSGAQADQFLHAHYYHRTFDGRRADYARYYEQNKGRPEAALMEAVGWWHSLSEAPSGEDATINVTAGELMQSLQAERLTKLSKEDFRNDAAKVHAMIDYARRVPNVVVGLPPNVPYTIPQKLDALCDHLWRQRTANDSSALQVLDHILYGGSSAQLPERLWDATEDANWKIDRMGVSALGELIGWAMPDTFPPRNGRTSKALRSLGYDVRIHVT